MSGLFCVVVTPVVPTLTACRHCVPLHASGYSPSRGVGGLAFHAGVISACEYPGLAAVYPDGRGRGGSV